MEIKYLKESKILVVKIDGEIDHHTCEDIRKKVDNEMQKYMPNGIIFDFSKVKFMDSSGIGVIIGRYKNMQRLNGKAAMVNVRPEVKRIFEISGLFKIIPLYDSLEQAISGM